MSSHFFLVSLFNAFLFISLSFASTCPTQSGPQAPVIGILSVPFQEAECVTVLENHISPENYDGKGLGSCFWGFYVNWLEQGGARVAVIKYDDPIEKLDELFSSINGILFTGGVLNLWFNTTYVETASYLYKKALQANKDGDYFPVWGTCMGFQLLCVLTAEDQAVLSLNAFDSENISWALDMTSDAPKSRMFGNNLIPPTVYTILSTQNVTENLHHDGVTPKNFSRNSKLVDFFDILSTNNDRKGKTFVSTIEGKTMPVYGVQWHPERPQYEWEVGLGLNHDFQSVYAMQYMSNFFVQEAIKSQHCFQTNEQLDDALIYRFPPVYIGNSQLVYYFPPSRL